MSKRFWIVATFVLMSVMTPGVANAVCTLTGVIVRVTVYDTSYTTTGGYIYFRTSALAPSYYYVTTNDDAMMSNAIAFMNSGRTVTLQGSAASCPAVPAAGGAASIGSLRYMFNP